MLTGRPPPVRPPTARLDGHLADGRDPLTPRPPVPAAVVTLINLRGVCEQVHFVCNFLQEALGY